MISTIFKPHDQVRLTAPVGRALPKGSIGYVVEVAAKPPHGAAFDEYPSVSVAFPLLWENMPDHEDFILEPGTIDPSSVPASSVISVKPSELEKVGPSMKPALVGSE